MKGINLLILALLLLPLGLHAVLPTCYHTYDEVLAELTTLQSNYPEIAKLVTIGYSQQDSIPIYAMRISNAVNTDESEPALLFVGQVHAEEVMGTEIVMNNINEILSRRNQIPYTNWLAQLDMWFIPTLNPEGHEVVTSNLDITYRKNKRDNNLNGIFDYTPSTGYDVDGVDINRNFDFNWAHGDSLLQPGGWEVYDYYRGPGAFSESETRALRNLCDQYKFLYSICWHESRTGNFSEKVYYPFNWKEERPSPDLTLAASIGQGVATHIQKENGTGTYEYYPNLSRKGAYHDWMYKEYGTMALLIECCTENIQPDSTLMVNTVQRCSNGVRWLLNRALRYSTEVQSTPLLWGNVTDAVTGAPLQAEIIIEEHKAPWFKPRTSFATSGRYHRPLLTGLYTVRARKKGYEDTVLSNVFVRNTVWTQQDITLQPKPAAVLQGSVRSGNTPVSARILLGDVQPDTLLVNGDFVFNGYTGTYPITVTADGYFPYLGSVTLNAGINHFNIDLSPDLTLFSENWEANTSNWVLQGPWVRQNTLSPSGYAITDSWGGNGFYDLNCNVWIKTANPIPIPGGTNIFLTFDSHLQTEWDYDPCRVEVSTNGNDWTELWIKSGLWDSWRREYVSLNAFAGQSVYLRFRLSDVSTSVEETDPGWTIDNIRVITGSSTSDVDDQQGVAPVSALYPNFPNPFNPETTISFSLSKASPAHLDIYNIRGQLVKSLIKGDLPQGDHKVVWNGRDFSGRPVASGVYLYRLQTGDYTRTLKMMLMK